MVAGWNLMTVIFVRWRKLRAAGGRLQVAMRRARKMATLAAPMDLQRGAVAALEARAVPIMGCAIAHRRSRAVQVQKVVVASAAERLAVMRTPTVAMEWGSPTR